MSNLVDEIKNDLVAFEQKVESVAVTIGTEIYEVLKVAVVFIGSSQARIILDLLAKIEEDVLAKKSLEEIETDLLQIATTEELEVLKASGSKLIQGLIAFVQASKSV